MSMDISRMPADFSRLRRVFNRRKKIHLASPFSVFLIVVALYAITWSFDKFSARRMEEVNVN